MSWLLVLVDNDVLGGGMDNIPLEERRRRTNSRGKQVERLGFGKGTESGNQSLVSLHKDTTAT
jgi:hypothetical protein